MATENAVRKAGAVSGDLVLGADTVVALEGRILGKPTGEEQAREFIAALKLMTMDRALAEQHYAEHEGKPFFGELVEFITSGPLVAMVLEGHEAVVAARQIIGATNPLEAATGSIRGDFAVEVGQNMVHGSDSPESGEREAKLFFG